MADVEAEAPGDPVSENIYLADSSSDLVDSSGVSSAELTQIARLMNALAQLREAERLLSDASRKYMKLSEQDMRALHYLIVAKKQDTIVTPGMLSHYLRISAASTTKLLNRLEKGEHIVRRLHPSDRRAFAIEVTPQTEASAKDSVGRQQARRFYSAARLTSDEREVVTRFLQDMTAEIALTNADWTDRSDHKK